MKQKTIAIIILILFILTACCDEIDTYANKDSKRIAQETILSELKNCNQKYGSSDASQREASVVYCDKVLKTISELVKEDYFDESIMKDVIINETTKPVEPNQEDEYLDTLKTEIMGDI